jgi:hypothetical protein
MTGFIALAALVTSIGVPFIIVFSREPEPKPIPVTVDARRNSRGVWVVK